MKRYLVMFLMVFVNFFLLSCGGQDLKSSWLGQDITVDGSSYEWENIPMSYYKSLNLMYGISNNDTSLCLLIRFNDPMLAAKISRRGMTIWFNDQDEKEKIFGIKYKDEIPRDDPSKRFNAAGEESVEDQKSPRRMRLMNQTGIFTLVKSNGDAEGLSGLGMMGLEAAADYEAGIFSYEFSVPLNRPFGNGMILSIPESSKIKSCLEIGGMSKEDKAGMKERMADRGRGGTGAGGGISGGIGGGRQGGGMGGMRPGGGKRGGGQMPDMDGKELWINVLLAAEPQNK